MPLFQRLRRKLQTKRKKHAKSESTLPKTKVKHRKATTTPQEELDSNRVEKPGYQNVLATGLLKAFQRRAKSIDTQQDFGPVIPVQNDKPAFKHESKAAPAMVLKRKKGTRENMDQTFSTHEPLSARFFPQGIAPARRASKIKTAPSPSEDISSTPVNTPALVPAAHTTPDVRPFMASTNIVQYEPFNVKGTFFYNNSVPGPALITSQAKAEPKITPAPITAHKYQDSIPDEPKATVKPSRVTSQQDKDSDLVFLPALKPDPKGTTLTAQQVSQFMASSKPHKSGPFVINESSFKHKPKVANTPAPQPVRAETKIEATSVSQTVPATPTVDIEAKAEPTPLTQIAPATATVNVEAKAEPTSITLPSGLVVFPGKPNEPKPVVSERPRGSASVTLEERVRYQRTVLGMSEKQIRNALPPGQYDVRLATENLSRPSGRGHLAYAYLVPSS